MAFNSAGVYSPASGATTAVPGAIIRSATWNSIFTDISSALTLLGQQLYNETTVAVGASPYTPLATDTLLVLTTSGGAITINLPSAASRSGYPLTIKDNTGNAATNNITVNRNGSDTIEGQTSFTIANNWGMLTLTPQSTTWIIEESSNVQNHYSATATVTGSGNFGTGGTGVLSEQSTAAPSSQAGVTGMVGTLASAPTLTNTGQAYFYNQTVGGAVLQGDGSTNDIILVNKSGSTAAAVPTGTQNVKFSGSALSVSGTGGVGYTTGAGTAVTQLTSRTTAVTSNTVTGQITMFTAAGSATAATFTVNCTAIAADDAVVLSQKAGTNLYEFFCTAISAATSFNITFFTTGGTASDTPVINYTIIKGSHN